ncbi:MAG TPA: hypothetical protein VHG28_10000 [Longimicrobiaceae bacterium]|nr:hypothetical protein [Longimicrobiaceae bacterium]
METEAAKPPRHGCLTTFLVVIVLANTLIALLYLLNGDAVAADAPTPWPGAIQLLGLIAICNVMFAVAVFRWKKWGFYGFAASTIIVLGINLSIGIGIEAAFPGVAGIAILYWTLHMGGERRAWPHLE